MERARLAALLGAPMAGGAPRDVVVEEREPARFMAAFARGVAAGGTVFVADPDWGAAERAQFDALVKTPRADAAGPERGWLCLPTGGSSGNLKLARHDGATLAAAVDGFCAHFGVARVNALGLLPLHHVSGLMAWLRCVLTGGEYRPADWKALAAGERPAPAGGGWFVSLVPTQLQRLLAAPSAVEWLRGFRAVFVGGGPAWPELVEAGAAARLPLAFSYGMTETAAMVAALRPAEFLAGMRGAGRAMPHARIALDAEERIGVEGASLFYGYWPGARPEGVCWTDDLGRIGADGSLTVLGRRDALIITGGEKVDPAEVEAALRATGLFTDVVVAGVPDAEWGSVVVACFPADGPAPEAAKVEAALAGRLAAYKRPKRYVALSPWPRNAQGKVNRAELARAVQARLLSQQ